MYNIFLFTHSLQAKLIVFYNSNHIPKLNFFRRLIFLVTLLLIIPITITLYNKGQHPFSIIMLTLELCVCCFASYTVNVLVSIKQFFYFNVGFGFVFSTMISSVSNSLFETESFTMLMFFIVYLVFWNFMSVLANTKVSLTVNTSISIILALFLFSLDYIPIIIPYLSTYGDMYKDGITEMFFPLLLVNGTATLSSTLKDYWITKYGEGNQLSWEHLEQ